MAIDILPETQNPPETQSGLQPQSTQYNGKQQSSALSRWWKRGLFAIGLVAVMGLAAVLIAVATSSPEIGPKLTHTITRGNLLVTVIEQGTLESSDNTEIKCKVRGRNTVIWVVESGTHVEPGDDLVRLDTLFIEEQIAERTKYALWSRSGAERSKADAARSKLAVSEYLEGRFVAELMTLKKDLAVSESNLRTAINMLNHAEKMFDRGYKSELEVEEKTFALKQAEMDVAVKQTKIEVLEDFTKREELATLRGNLSAVTATHAANAERAEADASRRDRALIELGYCVIKSEKSGMVIYPSTAKWKSAPDIEEGATVHKDQILLLMPDLSKMQVKIGIHESIVDRIKTGLAARVTLPDKTIDAEVISVASITSPAGWWTGNVVKYDTIIQLPSIEGLRPGMSAEVEVIIAVHSDVLTIPVAAVVETGDDYFCWIKTTEGTKKRSLQLGDSNEIFIVVEAGLKEGDEVVLNPLAFIQEAQTEAMKALDITNPTVPDSTKSNTKPKPQESGSDKQTSNSKIPAETKPQAAP